MESVDRNIVINEVKSFWFSVALRMESVDRNVAMLVTLELKLEMSLSAWRAWIEI